MCVNSIVNSITRKRRSKKRRGREEKEVKDQLGQCASIFKTVNIDQFHLFFKYIKHKYIVIKICIYIYIYIYIQGIFFVLVVLRLLV